jgi:predicted nucleic acid-binding protein
VIYVVDASVAIKWFLTEELHDRALSLISYDHQLYAPDLILQEVANIAWKRYMRDDISRRQAQEISRTLHQQFFHLFPSPDLTEQALDIALTLRHPVYDCLYIACAGAVLGTLVTDDRRLVRAVNGTDFQETVLHLTDLDLSGPGFPPNP